MLAAWPWLAEYSTKHCLGGARSTGRVRY